MMRLARRVLPFVPSLVLVVAAAFQPWPLTLVVVGLALIHLELVTQRQDRGRPHVDRVTVHNYDSGTWS